VDLVVDGTRTAKDTKLHEGMALRQLGIVLATTPHDRIWRQLPYCFRRLKSVDMKFILSFALLAAIAVAQESSPPAAASSPIQSDQHNAAKARAIIDQGIEALGGQAYLNFQDRTEEGRYFSLHHGRSEGVGAPYGRCFKFPDKDRFELLHIKAYHFLLFDVGNVAVKDKADIVTIHNGDKGFDINYKGTYPEKDTDTADYLRGRQHSIEWVLRKWLHEPGIALFYEGKTIAAQKDADQVTIMNAHNDAVTLYFDSVTHLPVKKSYSWRDPTDKERNVEEEIYDNYRPVQGIMTPFNLSTYYNGDMSSQRFRQTVTYNQNVSDSLFEARVTSETNKVHPK